MSSKSAKRQQQKSAQKVSSTARQYTPAAKAPPPAAKKQRGGLLTAAIVIMAIHGVFNTVALLALRKSEYTTVPPWLWATAFFVGVSLIGSAIGLWLWKRWGLWLYIASTAASIAVGLIVYPSMIAAFYNIIPLGILGMILNSQKKMQLLV